MKNKFLLLIGCLLILVGIFGIPAQPVSADVNAVCEPIPGTTVPTNFTGTAPASVSKGSSFKLQNITSSAESDLPVTITSSDLKLSATNASETVYFEANTSAVDDPETGYRRAVFPDWQLKATGAVGSTIVIKLVEATAHVENVGPLICPLTATLATIKITAASSSQSGGGSNTPSPTNQSDDDPDRPATDDPDTDTETDDPETEPTDAETDPEPDPESQPTAQPTQSVRIVVTDDAGNFLGGAVVSFDDKQAVTSPNDGAAVVESVPRGNQIVKITYRNKTVYQSIYVSSEDYDNNKTIIVPLQSNTPYKVAFIAAGGLFMVTSVALPVRLLF